VSRNHCVILLEKASWRFRDFGSKNGTFVNGEPVTGERELNPRPPEDRPLEFNVTLDVNPEREEKAQGA